MRFRGVNAFVAQLSRTVWSNWPGWQALLYSVTVWVKCSASSPQLMSQFRQRIGLCAGKDRRHEVADSFTVDDGVANLSRAVGRPDVPKWRSVWARNLRLHHNKTLSVPVHDYRAKRSPRGCKSRRHIMALWHQWPHSVTGRDRR